MCQISEVHGNYPWSELLLHSSIRWDHVFHALADFRGHVFQAPMDEIRVEGSVLHIRIDGVSQSADEIYGLGMHPDIPKGR